MCILPPSPSRRRFFYAKAQKNDHAPSPPARPCTRMKFYAVLVEKTLFALLFRTGGSPPPCYSQIGGVPLYTNGLVLFMIGIWCGEKDYEEGARVTRPDEKTK